MEAKDITNKLEKLREKWKDYPEKRKIIEVQAKLLQKALQIREPQPNLV